MTTDQLADRLAIADLVAAYARACDTRRSDEIADLYTDGGGFAIVRADAERVDVRGRDRMIRGFAGLARYEHVFHQIGQHTAELDGDRASGETYCMAHHVAVADDGDRTVMTMHIRYEDRFVRTTAGWRFEFRTLHVAWTESRPLTTEV